MQDTRDHQPSTRTTGHRQTRIGLLSAVALLTAATAAPAQAAGYQTETAAVSVDTIAGGLEQPWSVEVLPDGAYLVTELPGRLRLVRDGKLSEPITGLPDISVGGQGGLLDVAVDPRFADNRKIYFTASIAGDGGRGTAVFSATLSPDDTALSDVKRLFVMNRLTGAGQHFGARIAIRDDGTLIFGIGDRGQGRRAQDPQDHAGSLMRINRDGSVPNDNPYAASGQALPEIWSTGHRNPQGITIDPQDGSLYTVEHGARGGDEINVPAPGKNYGWPVISYGKDYSGAKLGEGTAKAGLEQPLHYWDPSIAPGAIAVYRGKMFPE